MSVEIEGAQTPVTPESVDRNGYTAADRAEVAALMDNADAVVVDSPLPMESKESKEAAVDPDVASLAGIFGADLSTVEDSNAATEAIIKNIELIAQAGLETPRARQNPTAPAKPADIPESKSVQEPPLDFSLTEQDLEGVEPELATALKGLSKKQQEVFGRVLAEAQAAKKLAEEANSRWEREAQAKSQQAYTEVGLRANAYLDSLNSPRYGKGDNRSAVQRIEVDAVHKLAGAIINGLSRYGSPVPTIEKVMQAAILRYEGKLVSPTKASEAAPAIPPLTPRQTGNLPSPAKTGVGSTGNAGGLMGDPEFLAGARAILSQ